MPASDPVPRQALAVAVPADDVAGDLAVDQDRLRLDGEIGQDRCPVGHERIAVAGGDGGHAVRDGVVLMLEQGWQVGLSDVAENHVVRHETGVGLGHDRQPTPAEYPRGDGRTGPACSPTSACTSSRLGS